jgi:hypothetical protein
MSARKLADMGGRLILIAAPRGMGRTIVVQFYVAIYADSKGLHQRFKLHPSMVPLSRGWYPVAILGFPSCTPADQVHPNRISQRVCGSGYSRTVLAVRDSPSVVRLCTSEPIASFLSFQAPVVHSHAFPNSDSSKNTTNSHWSIYPARGGSPTSTSSATRSNGIF